MEDLIRVRGAREHNLRGIDVDIPRNALVVVTGVSGSGKSSLVYDTIFQEGQRRFMESLSSYARQFLGRMERPLVEAVEGVSPTVSIDQKTVNRNPRSTVGTITEIYDHLRLLMARLGTPHCPICHTPVQRLSVDQVVERIDERFAGQQALVLTPVVQGRKGEYRKEIAGYIEDGWIRARIDGQLVRLEEAPELARYEKHTIELVVDRLVVGQDRARLVEAAETARRLSHGTIVVRVPGDDGDDEATFSLERACPNHPEQGLPELEPRLFSFNAPQGACLTCNGLGALEDFEVEKVVDLGKPIAQAYNAFNADGKVPFAHFDRESLARVVKSIGGPTGAKLGDWPAPQLAVLLEGDPDLTYWVDIDRGTRTERRVRPWRGLMGIVRNVWRWTKFPSLQVLRSRRTCPDCQGDRLNPAALAVTFRDSNIARLTGSTVEQATAWFDALVLTDAERLIGAALVDEIRERLGFLQQVGLGYLGLDRTANTLSGGESQRIRLASQVGSALQGVTYILDEPSIGLHPRDNRRLLEAIERLRDRGNSVLVVEHDAETMLAADWLVDIGPGAGREGGYLVGSGPPAKVAAGPGITAEWLRGERTVPIPKRRGRSRSWLKVDQARLHNLDGVTVRFPVGRFTVVTGVSGSGKSSLTFGVLEPSIRARLNQQPPIACERLSGGQRIDKLIRIAQTPIGRTPRSNPATYTKVFDEIRSLFAKTPLARSRGWRKGRFSFNVKGGRCEACQGAGVTTVEMQFLPSVEVPCEVCEGRRFNRETLEVHWKGKSIHDVLELTVAEAVELFANQPKIHRILATMERVGLGYVHLGQPSTTLSGGEAQRVKLATELHRPGTGNTVYLLDEPTTGLHFEDVARLIEALQALVDAGNTVIVVEHHTDVIKVADWLVDLGPEGGVGGGTLIAEGPPEEVARSDTPTGRVLADLFAQEPELLGEPEAVYTPKQVREGVLEVEGARRHNLKGVDLVVPHDTLTVITGPSGSGKSSLAFDTVFSEGQRRYVESLSTYARRFLGRLDRAPVTRIAGLQPAIAIDQSSASRNPRSTVATVTEIHDVLRLLYARIGKPHCPTCDRELQGFSPSQAARDLKEFWIEHGVSAHAFAGGPGWLVADKPEGSVEELRRAGWQRLLRETERWFAEVPLDSPDAERALADGASLVIDRFDPARTEDSRLAEAIERAYEHGHGEAHFVGRKGGEAIYAALPKCPEHGLIHPSALTPRHFSFNSQLGCCTTCDGLGRTHQLVARRLFTPGSGGGFWDALDDKVAQLLSRSSRNRALVEAVFELFDLPVTAPREVWPSALEEALLDGLEATLSLSWTRTHGKMKRHIEEEREWPGLRAILARWAGRLDHLMAEDVCGRCKGGRLEPRLLAVRIGDGSRERQSSDREESGEQRGRPSPTGEPSLGIHQLLVRTVDDVSATVEGWGLRGADAIIAERPLLELRQRLRFLRDVGLGYLTLDRSANTLSGGEAQRIRLASQLGSGLVGVTYVLDEPTVGLHPRDTERLLGTLVGLRDLGNTVLVVEHDPETIERADRVVDLGPGAGVHGGEVVAVGTPAEIRADPASGTGRWLAGIETMPIRDKRTPRGWITITDPCLHNLSIERARIPTGVWVGVSGVSGSGKSTLIMETLAPLLEQHTGKQVLAGAHTSFAMTEEVDRVVVVTQAPIGTTPRSTPATYTGVLDPLRKLFAQLPGSRVRGWTPTWFSWNSPKGGRCTLCEGRGSIVIEMHFLPDVWVICESCRGRRFSDQALSVRFKGKNIADVLGMRIDEAALLFANQRAIHRKLQALVDVGLGYLTLGQPANTLSGGEAQRVKLASELTSRKGHCVYILDEPTTGLHLSDVARLVKVLDQLVRKGHTVITIEHHLDMLRSADWLLDLGPEGGAGGGQLVAQGTIAEVIAAGSPTGVALGRAL